MAFKAILDIDGNEMRVLHCNYALQQDIDATGRPSSEVRGGTIHLEVESTEATDQFEWMTDSYKLKSGTIKFYKRDEEASLKELKFTDAYLVAYSESFDAVGSNPMSESFTLSAKKIEMGNGAHENPWAM